MGVERLTEIAARLREFGNQRDPSIDVQYGDYNQEFDLGEFGYREATFDVQIDSYEIELGDVLEDSPISFGEFGDLANEIDEIVAELGAKPLLDDSEAALEAALTQLAKTVTGAPLANAIRGVVDAVREAKAMGAKDATDAGAAANGMFTGDVIDPLTVPIKSASMNIKTTELRVGDLVLGFSFGRVIGFEGKTLVMNREGTRNTYDCSAYLEGDWSVKPIAVPDRKAFPPAYESAQLIQPLSAAP